MLASSFLLRALAALAVAALLAGADAARRQTVAPAQARLQATAPGPDTPASGSWELVARGQLPMPPGVPAAHASALLALPATQPAALLAFWFAGDRESAPNVQIVMSALDRATGLWSPARSVVDRWQMAQQLGFGVRRLGNPVAWLDDQGQVHLLVVATGLGGWAAGRIVHLAPAAPTAQAPWAWKAVAVLPLSWLWNTSYLVRTAPVALTDGGLVLPTYFELGRKYPVAVRLNAQGALLDATPISRRGERLQAALLPRDARDWLALMRDGGPTGRIHLAHTRDAGQHWSDADDLALDNPDASVATLTAGGRHWLVYNPQASGRYRLRLASSADGQQWRTEGELESGVPGQEYSYPALAMVDGQLWISYTDQRQSIAWQRWSPSGKPAVATHATRP